MGWGNLRLIADTDEEPRELLKPFALGEGFPLEVTDESGIEAVFEGRWGYLLESDCSLTIQCSMCGKDMCPGCGSRPDIAYYDGKAVASCPGKACQLDYTAGLQAYGLLPRGRKLRPLTARDC